jgi:hypothetical protein
VHQFLKGEKLKHKHLFTHKAQWTCPLGIDLAQWERLMKYYKWEDNNESLSHVHYLRELNKTIKIRVWWQSNNGKMHVCTFCKFLFFIMCILLQHWFMGGVPYRKKWGLGAFHSHKL